jgi:hypothetical protein
LQHVIEFVLSLESDQGYSKQLTIPLTTSLAVENFESGGFNSFAWEMSGNAPWVVTIQQPWEGNYCARSGSIAHSAFSELKLNYNVAFADSISFYYKVSSENNYDYLKFLIGGVQTAQWSGEKPWTRAVYAVNAGQTNFRWRYEKDNSVVAGSDCAWLDYIVLPARTIYTSIENAASPEVRVYPNPAGEWVNIAMKASGPDIWHFVLMDATGRIVSQWHQYQGSDEVRKIPLNQLKSGYYHLFWSNGKTSFSKPIIRY